MKEVYMYILENTVDLPDIGSVGYIYRHKKSGARVVYIENDDDNKVFTIGFRTPSENSTGVQHIIEHSTLCGSEKYPAKDPFVELAKGSLNTFLNAMTYPDKTVYPIASCNDVDFKNLMDIYMDAVFNPNIYKKEEIFKQEGWHYESDGEKFFLNGVVFNEMKGVYSSADDVLESKILQTIYNGNQYKYESGGDPEVIPSLTYEAFLDYHKRHYDPANSYIYLYGKMDIQERLDYLDREYLSKYSKENFNTDTSVTVQKPFEAPITVKSVYAVDEGEDTENSSYLSCSWIVGNTLDNEFTTDMQILDYALMLAPGAILKQRLVDKGIGADISSNFETSFMQPMYSIVVRNTSADKLDLFKETIDEVLNEVYTNGLDEKMLNAALSIFEFKYREADFGSYPRGLIYGLSILETWIYDETKPFVNVECGKEYDRLKTLNLSEYFKSFTKNILIDNKSCALVQLDPDTTYAEKLRKAEEKRVYDYVNTLSEEEKQQIVKDTASLKAYQDEPSTEEELLTIPLLSIDDIKKEAEPISYSVEEVHGVKCVKENIFSNNIAYVTAAFDMEHIADEDLPYAGLLSMCIGLMDTENYSYTDLTSEINMHTGGIFTDITSYNSEKKSDEIKMLFSYNGKAFYGKIGKMLELMEEQMLRTKFDDKKRMKELVAKSVSQYAVGFLSSGHVTSASIATEQFSKSTFYTSMTKGYKFYEFLNDLNNNFDERFDETVEKLNDLVNRLFNKNILTFNVTADEEGQKIFDKEAVTFINDLKSDNVEDVKYESLFKPGSFSIAYTSPSQVNYVARTWNFANAGLEYTGALRVLKTIFSYEYLWLNIRVKGGAYGCMSDFRVNGDSFLVSYRDPNIMDTNRIFEEAADYVKSFDVSDRDMIKYIIGTIGGMDSPLTPSMKGKRAFDAYIKGTTTEDIQKTRDEVLSTNVETIRSLAPIIDLLNTDKHFCVVGSSDMINNSKEMFDKIEPLAKN